MFWKNQKVKGKEAKEIQPEILELYIIFVCLI
jgi:hypothetical protein